jgi:hypothetical protein
LLGGDAGADHNRDEQAGAEELGEEPPRQNRTGVGHAVILTDAVYFSQD